MNDRYYNVKTAIDDIDIAKQITKSLLEKKLVMIRKIEEN